MATDEQTLFRADAERLRGNYHSQKKDVARSRTGEPTRHDDCRTRTGR